MILFNDRYGMEDLLHEGQEEFLFLRSESLLKIRRNLRKVI